LTALINAKSLVERFAIVKNESATAVNRTNGIDCPDHEVT
jgi:hypothetical protein